MEKYDFPGHLAIRVRNVGKDYRLGVINRRTFRDELVYRWMRLTGRDPRESLGKIGGRELSDPGLFHALGDVSFDVEQGETVGLIGRNGAGKSTMLKILARITSPTRGEAWLRGRLGSLLEVGTGFHPELTGRENIYLNGSILGMSRAEIDRKFDEIVAFAEIGEFLDTPVKRYSSGMYVRLAFSIAASLDTDVLLLDEVLAVGDAAFRRKCLARMKEIAASGRTILFVSHSMADIRSICSRCLLFQNGELAMDGPTAEVAAAYEAASASSVGGISPVVALAPPLRLAQPVVLFNPDRGGWDVWMNYEAPSSGTLHGLHVQTRIQSKRAPEQTLCSFDSDTTGTLASVADRSGTIVLEMTPSLRFPPGAYSVRCQVSPDGDGLSGAAVIGAFVVRSQTPPFHWRQMPAPPAPILLRNRWRKADAGERLPNPYASPKKKTPTPPSPPA